MPLDVGDVLRPNRTRPSLCVAFRLRFISWAATVGSRMGAASASFAIGSVKVWNTSQNRGLARRPQEHQGNIMATAPRAEYLICIRTWSRQRQRMFPPQHERVWSPVYSSKMWGSRLLGAIIKFDIETRRETKASAHLHA